MSDIGRALITLGVVLVAVGVVSSVVGQVPWLGRLPGDLYIKREHFTFYFPLTTSVLTSVALSLLFYLLRR
jgi:hypothetical protein